MVSQESDSEHPAAARGSEWITFETLVTTAGRSVDSLDGEWFLTLDLFGEGESQGWAGLDDTRPSRWSQPRDYEAKAGFVVQVPSCWNLNRPEWRYFESTRGDTRLFGWTPARPDRRVLLRGGGAAYLSPHHLNRRPTGR